MLDIIFSLNTLWWILLFLYVPACLLLIAFVLLQKGKGVGFAGAFGAGPAGNDAVFGPRSSKSLPQKVTYTMAAIFMLIALLMSMLSGNVGSSVAPELAEDTGIEPVSNAPAGSLDALFGDAPVSTPEAPTAPAEDASGTAAPAEEAATTPVTVIEAPAEEAPATEEAPAAEEVPAPAEEAAPAPVEEAPAAEVAAPAPAEEAPAAEETAPAEEAPETPAAQ